MKKAILIILQLALITTLFSQETETPITTTPLKNKHTIYAEVFGQGFSGSLNYDLLFNSEKKWKRSLTVGIIAVPRSFGFGDGAYIGLPVSYNWLFGNKRSHLELGIGLTTQIGEDYIFGSDQRRFSRIYTYLTPKIGYRFQPYKTGIFFRATLTPHVSLVNTDFSVRNGSLTTGSSFFNNFMNLGYRAFPWFGVSLGYTFK
ncbi:hypothetical protein [Fluviicola taffensis]|uniref:Outer membrane protein beta-barrel domain-containing protein n=1 Tax=Fluviicola taffensis (strain DSM 16823 / NCIMB 13979 / RW262) TaxID=755732 RepID=F2IEE0_FLUTR|nr:hypothetical protein [Fluviicola taffensis]AEA43464.1 hypothetical protein Fluta_1470 [Fluviicola taffensis DSM 16823]